MPSVVTGPDKARAVVHYRALAQEAAQAAALSLRSSGLQRKLHTWELDHLRQVVADQQALIEAQAAALAVLQRDLSWMEDSAERWRDDALQAIQDAGCTPGLTQAGHLVALQPGDTQ